MFNKILGNDPIKEIFRRLLLAQKIPRSLLFVGEEGIGKRTFALEIAKSAVCQNVQNGEACDNCAACNRATKFIIPTVDDSTKVDEKLRDKFKKVFFSEHSDIGTVVPLKKNIYVDAIRELETEANFRPYEAQSRFFLIDDADKMNDSAANALLKTLEEPPPTSNIFLITSRPAALLPTIRSRCQIIRFAPIETKDISDYLVKTKYYSSDDAEIVANLSAGSVGRALSIDIGIFREQREIMIRVLESVSGKQNIANLLKTGEEINDAKSKHNYEFLMQTLQNLIHDVWVLSLSDGDEKIINVDIKMELKRFAENSDRKKLAKWMIEIEKLRGNLSVNVNKKISTDALFLMMANS